MDDVVFKLVEKEFRIFVFKKDPTRHDSFKNFESPIQIPQVYFQTWIWNVALKFFIAHTYCVPVHNEKLKMQLAKKWNIKKSTKLEEDECIPE